MAKPHDLHRTLAAWTAILWVAVVLGAYWVDSQGYYQEKLVVFGRFLLGGR